MLLIISLAVQGGPNETLFFEDGLQSDILGAENMALIVFGIIIVTVR